MSDEQQAVPVAREVAIVAVTQADRDAVQAFHHVMLLRLMSDVKSQRPKLGEDEGDAGTLVQAFARHRLASLPCKSGEGAEREAGARNLYLLQGDNTRMAEALRKCRDQFAFYAREHYAAGKSEKGDTNTRFADIANKALTAVKPHTPSEQFAKSSPDAAGSGGEARESLYRHLETASGYLAFDLRALMNCAPEALTHDSGLIISAILNAMIEFAALRPDATQTREAEGVAAFGAAMFKRIWESFTDNGWEIEINDLVTVEAVKAGLVSVAPYDPEVHSDGSGAAEPGDDFYEVTPAGRAALNGRGGA